MPSPGGQGWHRRSLRESQHGNNGAVRWRLKTNLPAPGLHFCATSRASCARGRERSLSRRLSLMAFPALRETNAAPCMRPFKSSPISQHSSLSSSQFLCSTWNPVSSSRPIRVGRRRAQGLSGPAVALRWPPLDVFRPSLDSLEHVGTLVVVGMTRPRGARCQGTMDSRRNLVSGGSQ